MNPVVVRPIFPANTDPSLRLALEAFCDPVARVVSNLVAPPEYADNAAAVAGGMKSGQIYRTSTGALMVVL